MLGWLLDFGLPRSNAQATSAATHITPPCTTIPGMATIKLTREELYKQVWTTPASTLAAEYGISDVALAKVCKKYKIPKPGLGHWARVRNGQKIKRPPLSKAPPRVRGEITFRPIASRPKPGEPRPEPPKVAVQESLRGAHPLVRAIDVALGKATEKDGYGRLLAGTKYFPSVRVTKNAGRRMLLLLDSLLKGLAERGHGVASGEPSVERLELVVGGEALSLTIEEKLDHEPHVMTAEERKQQEQPLWSRDRIPKNDYFPCGRLSFRLGGIRWKYKGLTVWSDTKAHSLDDRLGVVILGMETAALAVKEYDIEQKRLERERQIEERRRARSHNLEIYQRWLADDLEQTVNDRLRANRIREFLRAFKAKLPDGERDEVTRQWIWAAAEFADLLDPLSRPRNVARPVKLSDDELAEFVERMGEQRLP